MWEKRVEPNSGTAHVAKCFPMSGSKAVHMCSTTLHDPILPHVQYHQEYALACLATCAVPPNMHDLT